MKRRRSKIPAVLMMIALAVQTFLFCPTGVGQENNPIEVKAETIPENSEAGAEAEEDISMILTSADAGGGKTVNLTVGEEIFYENYSTNYFDVDGKTAYCLEPLKDTPQSGIYAVQQLESGILRKGLYYMYGGPGYEIYRENFGLIGMNAQFSEQDEYCMSHCILSFLYSGSEDAFTGLSAETEEALRVKANNINQLPDPPESYNAFVFNIEGDGQAMGGSGEDHKGSLKIYKTSAFPEWTSENKCYSLENAVFEIYRQGEENPLWEVKTDENGCAGLDSIPAGFYEIAEKQPPQGYTADAVRHAVHITPNGICRYDIANVPQYRPITLLAEKVDSETGQKQPRGAAVFEGAEFRVCFYGGYYDSDPAEKSLQPDRTWVIRSDSNGQLNMSDSFKVSGDEFYRNEKGETVLPLGTVTIREIKAPEGYLINENVYIEQIKAFGSGETDTVYHVPSVPEDVIKGNLRIIKIVEDTDKEQEIKTSLEGIIFTITSDTTGEQFRIKTDKNGIAQTAGADGGGFLPYDTYTVSESNAPAGLKPADDFHISVSENLQLLSYIVENKQILAPVSLVKMDAETGKVIPIEGAAFRLLDANKNPITMTVNYPKREEKEIFSTDNTGILVLPEKLPVGTYYLEEIEAPEGYLLNREPVEFAVSEAHDWEEPLTVVCKDYPARGRISVKKTDSDTGKPIQGVEITVRAAQDITTPDGTIRVKRGTTVCCIITDENGNAETGELYLGKYEVEETKQVPGYVKSSQKYSVELLYTGQDTEIAEETLEIQNRPTKVSVKKTEYGTDQTLQGAEFVLEKKSAEKADDDIKREKEDDKEEKPGTYVTDEDGMIEFKYLLPGTYILKETESPVGYSSEHDAVEFTVSDDGMVDGESEKCYIVENKKTIIKNTKALWKENGQKTQEAGKIDAISDQVYMENLQPGRTYRLVGKVMDKKTGKELVQNGKAVSEEQVFTAEKASGTVTVELDVDTSDLSGNSLVIFEYLYEMDRLIASHEDLNDMEQTVSIEEKPTVSVQTGDDSMMKLIVIAGTGLVSLIVLICAGVIKKRRRIT